MTRFLQHCGAAAFAILVSFAGVAGAASIPVEVIKGGVDDDPLSWDDKFVSLTSDYVETLQLAKVDAGSCIRRIACDLDLSPEDHWEYLIVQANGYSALYWLDGGVSYAGIDVSSWGLASVGGTEFGRSWPKRGRFPDISSIRAGASAPMPEPGSAVLFAVGSLVVGAATRRRSRRSSTQPD